MKIWNRLFLLSLLLITSLGGIAFPVQAGPLTYPNEYDIAGAVNAVRASKGLPPLNMDGSLMAAAQAQSDYMASIGTWTHTGPDGSSPMQRDMAAGYGGGAKIFTSENVAYLSTSATLDTLIYSVWADSVHWATMVNASATDCGVGVTEKDGFVYYTLDVSYIVGKPASDNGTPYPTALPGTEEAVGMTATPNRIVPVQTAAAQPDGKVVHVVQAGQALVTIALAYGIKVADIRALNGIAADNNVVFVGQKLLIRAGFTPTVSPSPTDTEAPPTRTLAPTNTKKPPAATATRGPTQTITPLPLLPKMPSLESNQRQSIGIILVVICGLGLAGVLASYYLRKKQP
jgi:LysM repeat protein